MRLRVSVLASLSLGLFLTGCPLTDRYQLLDEDAGAPNAGGDRPSGEGPGDRPPLGGLGGIGGGETGSAGVGEAGEPAANGGSDVTGTGGSGGSVELAGSGGSSGAPCVATCNVKRACIANACAGGWVAMATPPAQLVARSRAASVAMGKSVFIWGGLDNEGAALTDGAIYNPALDNWKYLPRDTGSPSGRIMSTAVWTGAASNKVIVYGGTDAAGTMTYKDGAVYDVAENSWAALPPGPMNSRRSASFGYWDGTRAVFYGGLNGTNSVAGADRFDLKTWTVSGPSGDPGLLGFAAVAFDGSAMYLQGGVIGATRQDKVLSYTSSTDSWSSLSKSLSVRTGAFGAWDGTRFVVWGGQDDAGLRNDGKAMLGATWTDLAASPLEGRRIAFRRSGWSFQVKLGVVAIIGGLTSTTGVGTLAINGASYDFEKGQWTSIPDWTSLESHEYGIGVWTGEEFVIWGGRDQNVSTLTGERWAP